MSTQVRPASAPTPAEVRRWRRHLADERAEAAIYRDLAARRSGEEREILTGLAEAERRHESHWLGLLGDRAGKPLGPDLRTRFLGFLARHLGFVFVLALLQRAEARSPYEDDPHATSTMAADERLHGEVVRSLAERGRSRLSGSFRAAVFGTNDGLVSNLSLILGVGASGVPTPVILLTGLAGLLSGALSMGAGEYVSVRSQRELLEASTPDPHAHMLLPDLDINANELALLYRSRGMDEDAAARRAEEVLGGGRDQATALGGPDVDAHEAVGSGLGAATSSFLCFASGAVVPVIPYLVGAQGMVAVIVSAALVGLTLLATGAIVGLLSGGSPLLRGLRQLLIGYGAAGVTYLLGLLLGTGAAG